MPTSGSSGLTDSLQRTKRSINREVAEKEEVEYPEFPAREVLDSRSTASSFNLRSNLGMCLVY